MKKRLIQLVSTICALIIVTVPFSASAKGNSGPVETVKGATASIRASTSDIDTLMTERALALLNNDSATYTKITAILKENGVQDVSRAEVLKLTDGNNAVVGSNQAVSALSATSSANFSTVYSTYVAGGISYDVMRVYATPNGNLGTLRQSSVTVLYNSSQRTANVMAWIGSTALSTAGTIYTPLSAGMTVYGALAGAVPALSPDATITNIETSYTWSASEPCVFIYFKSSTTGAWILSGTYSQGVFTNHEATPQLYVSGTNVVGGTVSKDYNYTLTPANYGSIDKALNGFLTAKPYISRITRHTLTGIEGKSVKTVIMRNPDSPSAID